MGDAGLSAVCASCGRPIAPMDVDEFEAGNAAGERERRCLDCDGFAALEVAMMDRPSAREPDWVFVQDEDGGWGKYRIPEGQSVRTGLKRQDLVLLSRYKEHVVEPTSEAIKAIPADAEMCYDPHRISFVWLVPDDAAEAEK